MSFQDDEACWDACKKWWAERPEVVAEQKQSENLFALADPIWPACRIRLLPSDPETTRRGIMAGPAPPSPPVVNRWAKSAAHA